MKNFILVLAAAGLMFGCARVSVQAPKDPIKVDVSMRLDVYQHIAKDADNIEDMVSGNAKSPSSLLELFATTAYADDFTPEMQQAIESRKARRGELIALEAKGVVGENNSGLVEVRGSGGADALVNDENRDRMVIYQAVANKNGSSVSEVQRIYAKRVQADAPAGTPVQDESGWHTK